MRKHRCEDWIAEGLRCASCNPTAASVRDYWDDPIRKERDLARAVLDDAEVAEITDDTAIIGVDLAAWQAWTEGQQ